MKTTIILSVFLFLTLIINPVNCETGEIIDYVYTSGDYTFSYGIDNPHTGDFVLQLNLDECGIPDIYKIRNIHMDNKTNYSATAGNAGDPFNIWYSTDGTTKTELIGYGSFYVYKKSDAGDVAGENAFNVDLTFYFDEMNIDSELSGAQYFILSGSWVTTLHYYYNFHQEAWAAEAANIYNDINAVMQTKTTWGLPSKAAYGSGAVHEYYSYGSFRNDYDYNVTSSYLDIDIQRQGFNESYDLSSSNIKLVNYTDDTTYYYSSFSTSNTSHFLSVGTYNYYIVRELGDYEYLIYTSYEEEEEGDQTAVINFNQTHYTNPEIVGVQYDITGMDTANYEYWIEVMGNNGGTSIGVNAEYIELTDSSGQVNYTMEKQWLTLPMNIQSLLYAYDKSTGATITITQSGTVIYNPTSTAPGSVWTDKDSYNTTEIVTIYTDTTDGGKLKVDKRDDPLYDWYSIYSGQSNVKMAMQTSYVGTWDVYLYEDSILTNQTVFEVLADEDTAYFNWWNSPIYKGEPASYDYIATSANSMIRIYDGAGNRLYEFNASTGYNTGQITTTTGTVGNWTGSLYDNGTYYNSSLEVESSNSWVRFDRTDYYLEDMIQIEYFIVSQDHAIVLRDADNKIVLKWMPGTFMTGQRGTLDYTLVDNNEWDHDVQTQLWNGYIAAGLWYVGAEDINYISIDENPMASFDEATVHNCYDEDQIGGGGGATQGDGSIIGELTALAELAGFRGEVGLFILSILIIIITSAAMLISKFPVPGVLCIDILQFFAFIGIGFIPILYLILFGVVAGLIVFGTIFFRKAG